MLNYCSNLNLAYHYNPIHNLVYRYNPIHNLVYAYDLSGNMICSYNPSDNTLYAYDLSGNIICSYNLSDNTLYAYDLSGKGFPITLANYDRGLHMVDIDDLGIIYDVRIKIPFFYDNEERNKMIRSLKNFGKKHCNLTQNIIANVFDISQSRVSNVLSDSKK